MVDIYRFYEGDFFDEAQEGWHMGPDFEWFAIDSKGHIAFLTTAGCAAIPAAVFRSKPLYFSFFNYYRNLPVRCEVVEHSPCAEIKSWFEVAQRGLFVYDYSSETREYGSYVAGKPYRLIASPLLPLTLPELPMPIQEWLQPVAFKSLGFTQAHEVFPETEFADIIVQNKGAEPDSWGSDTAL